MDIGYRWPRLHKRERAKWQVNLENGWWKGYVTWRRRRTYVLPEGRRYREGGETIGSTLRTQHIDGGRIREYFRRHRRMGGTEVLDDQSGKSDSGDNTREAMGEGVGVRNP